MESIDDSSGGEEVSAGREQGSGREQWQRAPGNLGVHLLLWRMQRVGKKSEMKGKYWLAI